MKKSLLCFTLSIASYFAFGQCGPYTLTIRDSSCTAFVVTLSGATRAQQIVWNINGILDTVYNYIVNGGTTVAGGNGQGSAANQLYNPIDVYLDNSGNIYIADQNNNRIQKFPAGSTSVTNGVTVAGGNGLGSAANQLYSPSGLYVDGAGNIYVADNGNSRIQKFPAGSTSVTNGVTVAGGNGAGSAANQFHSPSGLYVDNSGNIYIADQNNSRIQKFPAGSTSATNGTTVAGGNGAGSAANQFYSPDGIYVDGAGNIYVADNGNNRIQKFPAGSTSATNGTTVADSAANQLYSPIGLYVDGAGNIYVTDFGSRIQKFSQPALIVIDTSILVTTAGIFSAIVTDTTGCTTSSNSASTAPILSSFFPTSASQGDTIIIHGSYLNIPTSVTFGGTSASSFSVLNDSTISAIVGNGSSGFVRVYNSCYYDSLAGFTYTGNLLTLYMDTVIGSNGQQVIIPVKVKNFKKMATAQGTIQFHQSVLSYAGLQQFGISSLNASNFGTTNTGNGILLFSWSDPTLNGVTLADTTVLFAIKFNVIGHSGQSSPVAFIDTPVVLQFADSTLNTVSYSVYNGLVNIDSTVIISGRVHSWNVNSGVQLTTVTLDSNGTPVSILTDTSGTYTFRAMAGSRDTITPSKNNDSLRTNGVSTLDVITIQRYILGTFTITGPYKLIAADVNSSGSITTLDYALIQSIILQRTTTFPGNKLWNFVPSNYTFSNPQSPWGFPTSRFYNNPSPQTGQDFIGIKLGDVTGAWNPSIRSLSGTNTVMLYVPQVTAHAGAQNISIPVKAKGFTSISGMQFTMTWDSTQFTYVGMDSTSTLQMNTGETMASIGMLGLEWINPNGTATTLPDDSTIFSLKFNVIGTAGDSSLINFDSTITAVQFIDTNLNIINYTLKSGKAHITYPTGIENIYTDVIKIYPNPASSSVIIDMSMTQPGNAELYITDLSGKLIYSKEISGQRTNTVSLTDFAEGIYMLQVRYADRVRNTKLVVIH
jgi:DNA-binding beta-propeller fold protein YncE